jgi:hypothetical protein
MPCASAHNAQRHVPVAVAKLDVSGLWKSADWRNVEDMFVDPVAIKALQNMLGEIQTLLSTTPPLPDNRTARCADLLEAAKALTNDMIKRGSRVQ